MKASDAVLKIQELIKIHGDVPVIFIAETGEGIKIAEPEITFSEGWTKTEPGSETLFVRHISISHVD